MIFLRIASLAGIVASFVAIGVFVRAKDSHSASLFVFVAAGFGILFAWSLRGAYLAPFEWARRFVQGVEGDHLHEWYTFKGLRVRVFRDAGGNPWMALEDIAPILEVDAAEAGLRRYGPEELGTPDSAPGDCLSADGLRRLVKHSRHRDAGALGLWLDREVLKVHGDLPGRETV